jgi:hypothetical protein
MLPSLIILISTFVTSSLALVHGVDSSTLVSEATYAKAKGEGFTKAIIRAYEEACGVGGQVDPNFVSSYKNARAAGITNIDAYWLYENFISNPLSHHSRMSQPLLRLRKLLQVICHSDS